MRLSLLPLLVVALLGCGDDSAPADAAADARDAQADSGSADAGHDAATDAGHDAGHDAATDAGDDATADAGSDAGSDAAADAGSDAGNDAAAPDCVGATERLQRELYETIGTCSVVVRLEHDSRRLIGHQVFCGRYRSTSEAEARAQAQADAGYGASARMLNPPMPEDLYVFYEAPGDFGGAAAVNARNGRTVFGGSIVWSGRGDITYPASWRDPAELGSGCGGGGRAISAHGYDLVSGGALDAADVDAAVAVVADTAVPAAFWAGGYVFDAVVLRYPRSVGVFDPSSAEWIVVVNGGWLD